MPSHIFWGMQHLNGNVMATIMTDAVSEDGDMVELCILPVDNQIKIHKAMSLFNMRMKFDPSEVDFKYCRLTRGELAKAQLGGFTADKVADLFESWFDNLKLSTGKKIIPLSYEWPIHRQRLINWLGYNQFQYYFGDDYRDLLCAAHLVNDRLDCRNEPVHFSKQNLAWICKKLQVENIEYGGSCTDDCRRIMEAYRAILTVRD